MIWQWGQDNYAPYLSRTGFLGVVDFTHRSKPIKFVHCCLLTCSKLLFDGLATRVFFYA